MPLPGNFSTVPVHGKYLDLAGAALAGTVTFTATPDALTDPAALIIIMSKPLVMTLDVNGEFTTNLPATDDPDIDPIGFTYKVVEAFPGRDVAGREYYITVPVASLPGGIDLTTAAPAIPVDGVARGQFLNDLGDVDTTGAVTDSPLVRDSTGEWVAGPALSATFASLSAVGRVRTTSAGVLRPKVRALTTRVAAIRPLTYPGIATTVSASHAVTLPFTPNGSWARSWGPVGWQQPGGPGTAWTDYEPYNAGSQGGQKATEFCTDAPIFGLTLSGGGGAWEVYCDDELIIGSSVGTPYPGTGSHQIIDWSGRRQSRRYLLRWSVGMTLGGIVTDSADTVWAPADDSAVYCGWMCDSYGQSGNVGGFDVFPSLVSRMLGWRPIVSAVGGTGYSEPTGTVAIGTPGNFEQRIPEFLSLNTRGYSITRPDVMVLAGGHNNTGVSAATMQARVQADIDTLVAGGMKVGQIVVLGVLDQGDFWHNGTYVAVNAGLAAGAAARGAVFIANPGWITGTGYQGSPAYDGNADVNIYTDATHPSPNGAEYFAARIADALTGAF